MAGVGSGRIVILGAELAAEPAGLLAVAAASNDGVNVQFVNHASEAIPGRSILGGTLGEHDHHCGHVVIVVADKGHARGGSA